MGMERLIALWCPGLLREGERGDEARAFLQVLVAAERFCPWVDPVSLGICTIPSRGPSRFFGGERAVVEKLAAAMGDLAVRHPAVGQVRVGAADGLFAALLAARSGLAVPRGETAAFLAPCSVAVLRRTELAVTLQRLGVHTLGQFAALPARDVLARFGADAGACHRVAGGDEGELVGLRDSGLRRRLETVRTDRADAGHPRQPGFFGGASAADARAAEAFARVQERLGAGAVVVGRLQGGRSPEERASLVPWGARGTTAPSGPSGRSRPGSSPAAAPWPGRLPVPSPTRVLGTPVELAVTDDTGRAVQVTARGLLDADPAAASIGGGPWQEVRGWAGPWPSTERWWSSRRRRARLQILTAAGALLVVAERGGWWVEALYE
ncbi:MAG TPA: hypothetical protein VGL60_09105 [Acidimicrobiales bacterium]